MKNKLNNIFLLIFALIPTPFVIANNAMVIQTDFGLKDGAVSEMQGIAFTIDHNIKIYNLTHEIPTYNIWEASYRLYQAAPYWPKGTVFVSVVDPGVGTNRKSVVLLTKSGQYFVTPDNGTLTLVASSLGIDTVREIDETTNRRTGSEKSYTFHGRDVYAYTAAKLATEKITFEQVGKKLPQQVVKIAYQKPILVDGVLKGNIPVLDIQYGNLWSNIDNNLFKKLNPKLGETFCITIKDDDKVQYSGKAPYANTFGYVNKGEPLVYLNSLMNVSVALNMDSFSQKNQVFSGPKWNIEMKKCN